MMKKIMFLLLLSAVCGTVSAQSVVSVVGGSTEMIAWTVGEVFTESIMRSNVARFSQGFNQPFEVSPSGVLEVSAEGVKFTAFPNPVVDVLQVAFPDDEACAWRLYDLRGVLLASGEVSDSRADIDFSDKSAGKYVLEIANGADSRSVVIIKK